MLLASLLLTAAPVAALPAPQDRRAGVTASYHELAAAKDAEGLGELWKDNVGLVLQVIDADLEGSLSLWEAAKDSPPTEEIAKLHERALFGAYAASDALGQPIFADYASSFVGWDDEQKLAFRAGQAVFGRAAQELRDGDKAVAITAGQETIERAIALGDWWGAAMGYAVKGEALRAEGEHEDALSSLAMARQINHALGLQSSELRNVRSMLAAARALERHPRALSLAASLATLAEAFQDNATLRQALTAKAELETALNLPDRAAATRARLESLPE